MQTDIYSVREVFFALCKSVDTPVSLGAWLRFEYNQTELAKMDINPRDYTSREHFQKDYTVVSLLSKWKGLKTDIDLDAVAIQKFRQSEDHCHETNLRLKHLDSVVNPRLHAVLHSMQRKISKLLGPFSLFCVNDAYGWGPGATSDLPRRRAFLDTKICELPISVSGSARNCFRNEIENDLHWSFVVLGVLPDGPYCLLDHNFVLADECQITTVPKNAKTHRVIAIEPRGNAFLQKGVGGYIRKRLRTVGIDLDNQEVNQELACRAFSSGLCTLDLKSASDSVSIELVWALLPYEWASFMDSIRSRYAILPDGSKARLKKFSSMGNGFTFELETLIFWSLITAVAELSSERGPTSVYGDDIIVPASISDEVVSTLKFIGFEINDDKSFTSGRFFESCGKHFFDGVEVTPAYQKEVISDELALIRFTNRLIRLAFRIGGNHLDSTYRTAWMAAYRQSKDPRWAIPFGSEGDDGFALPYTSFPFRFGSNPNRGVRCRVASVKMSRYPGNDSALLAWSHRRGVKTDSPFMGDLLRTAEGTQPSDGFRWVIPNGKFSVRWV